MKYIYFYDRKRTFRFIGLGQAVTMAQVCYFKGKELGYNKIIFEWHNQVTYPYWTDDNKIFGLMECPTNSMLPIKFVKKGTQFIDVVDKIDLSEENSLYDGCPAIISKSLDMGPMWSYLNKYYLDTKERPIFNIPKDKMQPYILFHYRDSPKKSQQLRNTPYTEWKQTFQIIKKHFGNKYKLKKIGEASSLDNEFDEVIDYFPNNIQELFKVINNSSFFIGCESGPIAIAYMFGIPSIVFLHPETDVARSNKKWKTDIYYGKDSYDWVDNSKYYILRYGEYNILTDKDELIKFMEEYIE